LIDERGDLARRNDGAVFRCDMARNLPRFLRQRNIAKKRGQFPCQDISRHRGVIELARDAKTRQPRSVIELIAKERHDQLRKAGA
jgi:hypothetical protein